jgi:Protein of unknown function (DUF3151)
MCHHAGMADDVPNVNLSSGLPETVLPSPPAETTTRLAAALALAPPDRMAAVAAVVADYPRLLEGWAALGDLAAADGKEVAAYAYYRVGYHRGLDTLRQSGWRGSGYVRWKHESNHGFLRSLDGLRRQATVIGEQDEAARCAEFLVQLDPGAQHP